MNTQFIGSHYALVGLPVWASSLILFAATMGVIYVLRDIFENLPYQVAYSAQFGDAMLVGAVLIAATTLQRGEVLPGWLIGRTFHLLAAIVSIGFGVTWWSVDRPKHWGDIYHHLFVAPLILYLAITLSPVILINGTKVEKLCSLGFALLWAALVIFDVTHARMNQRKWLESRGVTFQNKQ